MQTIAVTPDRRTSHDAERTPRDTERTSSVRKSLKKSAGKKTPQRDTMDVDGEFTGLRSCGKDSPKPAGSQVSDAPATPGGSNLRYINV